MTIPDAVSQPYYVRQTQPWAIRTERQRHAQAIYSVGEFTMFLLMWHLADFKAGLVQRCAECYLAYGRIAEVYGQPAKRNCLTCYGTTFQGGIKARIVRPAIWSDTDLGEGQDRRGVVHPDDVDIESTPDFRVRQGDYAFRQDGTRWALRVPQRTTVRTGFADPTQTTEAVGYNLSRASLEDRSSVAYLIPPAEALLMAALDVEAFNAAQVSFASIEQINGPLIPPDGAEVT